MEPRFNITVGILFILVGVLLGSDYIIQFAKADTYAQSTTQLVSSETRAGVADQPVNTALPTHISVPVIGVSVDIEPGYYNYSDGIWTVGDKKASFATVTSVPNAKAGNTYMYGHNRPNIFTKLNNLILGDKVIVTNSDNKMFTYKLVSIRDVQPDDVSFLEYSNKPILTLQTCSGFWDQYRRLFIFDLESEK